MPTQLVKTCLHELAPIITEIVNTSLQTGTFPSVYKNALVIPILKKSSLDSETLNNYRPVSNLAFVSKLIEKVVSKQLHSYLSSRDLHEINQSAYRQFHSTETALLKIKDDITIAIGNRKAVLLVLLDLSAAFDTINHAYLLQVLQSMGVAGTVLKWFSSYLRFRKQSIVCNGKSSATFDLDCGVPQGSVLGPILFTIYTSSLGKLLSNFGMSYHFYADDTQLYVSFDVKATDIARTAITDCVNAIRGWMRRHHLKMNDSKTEVMYIGNKATLSKFEKEAIVVGDLTVTPESSVKSLGVLIDERMEMIPHINSVCRTAYIHIRNIARIKQFLTRSTLEILVHAFVTSKLDYCNVLFLGLPQNVTDRLQSVLNSAARLIDGSKKFDHITPVLHKLHWLPIKERVIFKVLLTVFKAKNNMAPKYITDMLVVHDPVREMRSSTKDLFDVPFTRCPYIYDRSFSHAAPRLWNDLPLGIRQGQSIDTFKKHLKTYLFSQHFGV